MMTDKEQIMINSVDVSECVHYEDLSCTAFRDSCGYPLDCKDFFSCNYKQLARKTQECEQKDKELLSNEKIINKLMKEVDELRQECEELKRKLSNQEQLYQNEIEIYNQSCLQLRQENDDLYLERLALNTANGGINSLLEIKEQENDRYRKALEEIEKVCIEDTRIFADGTEVRYDSLDKILDIISKADFGKSERSETRLGESCVEPVEPPIIQEAKGEE